MAPLIPTTQVTPSASREDAIPSLFADSPMQTATSLTQHQSPD